MGAEAGIASDPSGVLQSDSRLYLAQIVIIMVLCQALGLLIRRFNQPRVIAEVLGGILLGPTFLGQIPNFSDTVFPAESLTALKLTATLGLVLFLFIVGLELDISLLRGSVKRSAGVSLAGQALAWSLSIIVSSLMYSRLDGLDKSRTSFTLFIGISMAVTAFPVLSRILTEQHLLGTKVGVATISAAAFDDVAAWCMLALVIAIVNAGSPLDAVYVFLLLVSFTVIMLMGVSRLLALYIPRLMPHGEATHAVVFVCLLVAIFSGWVTDVIGIDAIFGGFIAGLAMPRTHNLPIQLIEKIEEVVGTVLLPLYFAISGLKTDFTALNSGQAWGFVVLVVSLSCFGKIVGCGTAAKLTGLPRREAMAVGVLMNTRGLVEIIILNIGLDAGVISQEVFAIMILMAVFTTFLTSPLVLWVYPPKYQESATERALVADDMLAGPGVAALPPPSAALELAPAQLLAFAERRLRLLVCVPDLRALISTVKVVRLISHPGGEVAGPFAAPLVGSDGGGAAALEAGEGDGAMAPAADGGAPPAAPVTGGGAYSKGVPTAGLSSAMMPAGANIHALRLVETSDDYRSDMMSMHLDATLRNDELAGLLQTFGQMNSVTVQPHIAIGSETTHFAQAIVGVASGAGRNTVIMPWMPELPEAASGHGGAADDGTGTAAIAGVGAGGVGSSRALSGEATGAMVGDAGLKLLGEVLDGARERRLGNVVVMLDRGLCLGRNRIMVPFLGGADDEEALMLALALMHPTTELVVLRVRGDAKSAAGGGANAKRHSSMGKQQMGAAAAEAALQEGPTHPNTMGGTRLMAMYDDPKTGAGKVVTPGASLATGDPVRARAASADGLDAAERGGNSNIAPTAGDSAAATGNGGASRGGSLGSPLRGSINKSTTDARGPAQRLLDSVSRLSNVRIVDVFQPSAPSLNIYPALLAAMQSELKGSDARSRALVVCGRGDCPQQPLGALGGSVGRVAAAAVAAATAAGCSTHNTVAGSAPYKQYGDVAAAEEAQTESNNRTWSHMFRSKSRPDLSASAHATPARLQALGRTGATLLRAYPDVSLMVLHSFGGGVAPSD